MNAWALPTTKVIGGTEYALNADFRDVLEIMSYLNDLSNPEVFRWNIAVALFYEGEIPQEHLQEAMEYLADFIRCREKEDSKPMPKLLDWDQDAKIIVADVNKVAGTEIRALPFLHWWTFLAYFHAIGEGQLSTLVSIRDKLHRGKKLEKWEQEYYRDNKARVEFHVKQETSSANEQSWLAQLNESG